MNTTEPMTSANSAKTRDRGSRRSANSTSAPPGSTAPAHGTRHVTASPSSTPGANRANCTPAAANNATRGQPACRSRNFTKSGVRASATATRAGTLSKVTAGEPS